MWPAKWWPFCFIFRLFWLGRVVSTAVFCEAERSQHSSTGCLDCSTVSLHSPASDLCKKMTLSQVLTAHNALQFIQNPLHESSCNIYLDQPFWCQPYRSHVSNPTEIGSNKLFWIWIWQSYNHQPGTAKQSKGCQLPGTKEPLADHSPLHCRSIWFLLQSAVWAPATTNGLLGDLMTLLFFSLGINPMPKSHQSVLKISFPRWDGHKTVLYP